MLKEKTMKYQKWLLELVQNTMNQVLNNHDYLEIYYSSEQGLYLNPYFKNMV